MAVLLLGVAWRVYDVTGNAQRDGRMIRFDAVPGSIAAHKIRNAVSRDFRETLLAVIAATPAQGRPHLASIAEEEQTVADTLKAYRETIFINPATDSKNVADFESAWTLYVGKRNELLQLSRAGTREAALAFSERELSPIFARLNALSDTLVTYNDRNAKNLSLEIIEGASSVRVTVIVTVVIAGIGALLLFLNLVARRREERLQAQQEARFAKALSLGRAALWVRDFRNGTVEWSDSVDSLLAHPPGGVPRSVTGWLDLVHPEDRTRVQGAIESTRVSNAHFEVEYRVRRGDGSFVWIRDSGNVSEATAASGPLYGVIRDISERKRAQANAELLEAQLRQAQKLEAIGTLAGGIAHDFNNILTGISGTAELAVLEMADEGNTSPMREPMETILRASKRAASLVRQILTFCRQSEKRLEPIALSQVVDEVVSLMRSTMPANIELACEVAPALPLILGDGTQVHQVLVNLCTNAAHAMRGSNGRLTVGLDALSADEDFVMLHPDLQCGPHLRLTVTDTGHGMPPETLKRIFEPFFTTKGPTEGTGLGLSVVHGILRAHGGGIYCYSHLAEGTTFHVYFPVPKDLVGFESESTHRTAPKGSGEHVLVVDDEPEIRRTARSMLIRLGYTVSVASDFEAAVALFRAAPDRYDLVLTDMAMPNNTGLDLARALAAIRPDVVIVLMTGFAGSLTPESLRKIGVRELILKPLTVDRLGVIVHRALARDPALATGSIQRQ